MNLNVALVGLTHPHSQAYLRSFSHMDDVEAVFVADESAEAVAQAKEMPKVAAAYTDLDDLLRRDDVPLALVLKPNDQSVPTMLRVVAAGKHVLSDKPGARTADDLARVVAAAADRNVFFSVCYQNRFRPDMRQILHLREGGAMGRLMSAEFRMLTTAVALRNPRHWLFHSESSGGGILHWLGCHYVDLLRYLTGEEVTAVSAMARTLSGEAIDVEDVITVSFSLSGGTLASLHAGYVLSGGRPGYINPGYDTYVGLRGTHGRTWTEPAEGGDLAIALETLAPEWDAARKRTFSYSLPQTDAYAGVYGSHFLRAMFAAALEGRKAPVTAEDAVKVLRIIEAAYESSASGKTVML